jgi:hypothetical protein
MCQSENRAAAKKPMDEVMDEVTTREIQRWVDELAHDRREGRRSRARPSSTS